MSVAPVTADLALPPAKRRPRRPRKARKSGRPRKHPAAVKSPPLESDESDVADVGLEPDLIMSPEPMSVPHRAALARLREQLVAVHGVIGLLRDELLIHEDTHSGLVSLVGIALDAIQKAAEDAKRRTGLL
jgi:hypothetical protein